MTTTQVLLVAEVEGDDAVSVRDTLARLAQEVCAAFPGSDVMMNDPRETEAGGIEVAALVGGSDLAPLDAVRTAVAALPQFIWQEPAPLDSPKHEEYFAAEARPEGPFVRLEAHAAQGLGYGALTEPG